MFESDHLAKSNSCRLLSNIGFSTGPFFNYKDLFPVKTLVTEVGNMIRQLTSKCVLISTITGRRASALTTRWIRRVDVKCSHCECNCSDAFIHSTCAYTSNNLHNTHVHIILKVNEKRTLT